MKNRSTPHPTPHPDAPGAKPARAYRQQARAQAAEATGARILAAFRRRLCDDWYDQITLDEVARDAGVTVQTVLRRFGDKEGLLAAAWESLAQEVQARRVVAPGDAVGAVRVIVADYEAMGDLVMRALAQEERFPALAAMNDIGRAHHRAWIETAFAPWLDGLAAPQRRRRIDALVAATDLYIWKLVRRDMGRSARHVRNIMIDLVAGIVGETLD